MGKEIGFPKEAQSSVRGMYDGARKQEAFKERNYWNLVLYSEGSPEIS